MKSFLKTFLAALVALIVFFGFIFLLVYFFYASLVAGAKSYIEPKSVLVVDLSRHYADRKIENPLVELSGNVDENIPTLFELVRLIQKAKADSAIRGILLKCNDNGNGFASSEEIAHAVSEFKKGGKFVIAYGDFITQKAYHVASVADKIYCNPKGILDWRGFSAEYMYFKKLLDKLEVQPQIFYDGKFKSATEPFREEKMTEANRLQTSIWLGDLYGRFLGQASARRKLDSAALLDYANRYALETAEDALRYKLIDGLKYDDELKEEIKDRLGMDEDDAISFVTPGRYLDAVNLKTYGKKGKVAIIYAEGDIVYGKSTDGQVGSNEYRNLIRKVRYNKDIKALVLRVNSPGGSSLASEILWREIDLTRKAGKPVVVSMGDLAASGGYYIACGADSIFAQPNTLTGSIGVFAMIPNMQSFFDHKLGITFDRVKTAEHADALTISRPLSETEKGILQRQVDRIYVDFKGRVAEGRKKDTAYIDSIAQGRVWTGQRALQIGLVDKIGTIQDAIDCAARLAKIKEYDLREYPEPKSLIDILFSNYQFSFRMNTMAEEMGEDNYRIYREIKRLRKNDGMVEARMPYDLIIR